MAPLAYPELRPLGAVYRPLAGEGVSRSLETSHALVMRFLREPLPASPAFLVAGPAASSSRDSQIPAYVVRAYAGRVGGRHVSLDAGHFAMLVRETSAMGALTSFLRARAGDLPSMREPRP